MGKISKKKWINLSTDNGLKIIFCHYLKNSSSESVVLLKDVWNVYYLCFANISLLKNYARNSTTKQPTKKKDIWNGKNISRIYLKTLQKSLIELLKIINRKCSIKLGPIKEEWFVRVQKKIKRRKSQQNASWRMEDKNILWRTLSVMLRFL